MTIVAIDDEELALEHIESTLRTVAPDSDIHAFSYYTDLLDFARENKVDVAFLDIQMRGMLGIDLAKKLSEIYPEMNIVFTTGYSEYAVPAFDMYASAYLLKPITADDISNALCHLRHPVEEEGMKKLQAHCFGNFDIYADGIPLKFQYSKAKELLAYLIDRKGASVSMGEAIAILWEDDAEHKSYYNRVRLDLISTLSEVGFENAVNSVRGYLSINKEYFDCDYYDYLDEKEEGLSAFKGEYMEQYSWSEMTLGNLIEYEDY